MNDLEPCRHQPRGRVLAIGDIHGNEAGFRQLLRMAGLVNSSGDWIGGDATLVLTGDVVGRGGNPRRRSLARCRAAAGHAGRLADRAGFRAR